MLADEILDLSFGPLVERIVGGAHVGEFGVGAPGWYHASGKERVFRRDGAKRAVGVPETVAELEEPNPVFGRHDVAVLVEVREIGNARPEPLVLLHSDVARRRVALQFAEMPREGKLLLVGQWLVAKNQHCVAVHAGFDRGDRLGVKRRTAIDSSDLAGKDRGER